MIHVGLRTGFVGDSKFREGEICVGRLAQGFGLSKEVFSIALIDRSTQGASESADIVDE
jgi:hypothetical protein